MNKENRRHSKRWVKDKIYRSSAALMAGVLLIMSVPFHTQAAEESGTKRVLFLSSYSYSWPTVPLQIQGIEKEFGDSVELDVEFMDTKQIADEESIDEISQKIQHKIDVVGEYDAVITGDDAALHFAEEHYDTLFTGVPVVFEAVNDIKYAQKLDENPNFTGVVEQISYEDNIRFARKIQPDAKRIVAIVDDTVTGKAEQEQFMHNASSYPDISFEMLNASTMTHEQLIKKISKLSQETILLYLILSEDNEGNTYTNSEVCRMLKENAQVPVFRFVQAGIGNGVLGGNIVLHEKSGEIAGDMVKKILDGTPASEIPVECKSPNGYYLDENIIREFDIPESVIPDDAIVINHQVSFMEKHGTVMLIVCSIAVLLILFITLATRHSLERKRKLEMAKKNKELEAALVAAQQADESKSRFLAQTSHEIRTPLNIIIGLTGLAKEDVTNSNMVKDYLGKIEGSSKLLLGIINNILDMSAISDGKMKIDQTKFDFRQQITNLSVMFYQQGKNKNIRFDIHLKGVTEEFLIGDSLRLNQILMNILGNSMKFTPAGGNVSLTVVQASTSRERVHMRFIIKDTGCGMSEDMMSRLFKVFEQEDASTARKHGGSGLGMAITKNLIDLMGGTIRVESEQGKGTEFTVDIPFGRAEQGMREKLADTFASYRALIVADSEESCHERGFCLVDMGLTYDIATDEETALDMIGQAEEEGKPYKICVVDWRLSEKGGEEFVAEVREIFGDAMIIIGASFDLAQTQAGGLKAGANYMVGKPVFRSTLFDAMMRVSKGEIEEYNDSEEDDKYEFSGKRVLIAEDIALNMEVAVKLLSRTGIRTSCVENGQEAIEIFNEQPEDYFDCIFLDINMPVMDGYEAARGIRSSNKGYAKTVPIYAMTANAFTSDVAEALDAGMDGHIAKPIEKDVLYKTLAKLFEEN